MNYPIISEYVEAIKAAEDNFEELKNLRPVLDDDGMPVMSGGNFAVVFKMKDEQTGKLHAVKCFLKEQEGRAEAYRLIAEELEFVSSTFLTPIKYLDKELFVDSVNSEDYEFPVLLMDWVEGQTLDKYIRQHIDDQYEMSLLAYQFSRLAMWLMPQPFAHGDLKPDNILVRNDGTLVLVDYDGMYVPAMKGQKARELGSPDFRHPGRTEEVFDEHIDDFSLASILLSLKAIDLQPSLLEEYGASDRLLFSEKDYRNLSESSALGALQPLMQDAELASLYSLYILALSQNNLSQVSFRLFNLKRPARTQYEEENLSTEVTKDDLANAWTDEYGVKYSADRKRLLSTSKILFGEYVIKKGTKVICNNAFRGIKTLMLKSVSIPEGVEIIGDRVWGHCPIIREITLPKSLKQIGEGPFACSGINHILCYSEDFETDGLALYSKKDSRIVSVCNNVKEFDIPITIKEIGASSFSGCELIKSIAIPKNVNTIGEFAFWGCKSLEHIVIPENVTSIGPHPFVGSSINHIDCHSPFFETDTVALYDKGKKNLIEVCKNVIRYSIPDSVTCINAGAFWTCKSLEYVSIPNSVKSIGEDAFNGCESLKMIIIPNGIKVIEKGTFFLCKSLESIIIPNSIKSVGVGAFYSCSSLKTIVFHDCVTDIGTNAFEDCTSLETIIIPIKSKEKFEKLIPDHKDKLVEQENGWTVKSKRAFSPDEIAAVARAEVVPSQYGNSVCLFMNSGRPVYIPLLTNSSLTVGDSVDLTTAKLVTLCREGKDDIYRVME